MKEEVVTCIKQEIGSTAIEYALIACTIVTAIAATIGLLGANVAGLYRAMVGIFH